MLHHQFLWYKTLIHLFRMIQNNLKFKELPESVMIFGCGYIGTALAKVLLGNGVRVGALTRNQSQAELLRSLGAKEVLQCDLHDANWPNYLQLPYQSAVNCVSSAGGGLLGYRQSYVDGQKVILDWANTQKLNNFIYTSSTSVYPQSGGVVVTEQMSTQDCSESALLLLESERLIQEQQSLFQKHYIFRLAGIYGPKRHYLLDQLKAGSSIIAGRGDYHLNLIHCNDAVNALLIALSSEKNVESGIFNLSDGNPSFKHELVSYLASKLGLKQPVFDPSSTSLRVRHREGSMPDRIIANNKLIESFGWQPIFPEFRSGYEAILSDF